MAKKWMLKSWALVICLLSCSLGLALSGFFTNAYAQPEFKVMTRSLKINQERSLFLEFHVKDDVSFTMNPPEFEAPDFELMDISVIAKQSDSNYQRQMSRTVEWVYVATLKAKKAGTLTIRKDGAVVGRQALFAPDVTV